MSILHKNSTPCVSHNPLLLCTHCTQLKQATDHSPLPPLPGVKEVNTLSSWGIVQMIWVFL